MTDVGYEHTQDQPQLASVLAFVAVVTVILAVVLGELWLLLNTVILGAIAILGYALSSLTTKVTTDAIEVDFRWGRPHRISPHAQILSAEVVRNRWWYGWGIRWIPGGTMYNVWGLDAVHLDLADGRGFRIGTDDPHGLVEAIERYDRS